MKKEEILKIFHQTGALLEGHFLLSSGLHSPRYFQCARVLQYPKLAELLCREIAQHFAQRGVEAVIAPAIGGIVVAQEVARLLGVRAIFAEREEGKMILRRGFEIKKNEKVLVVEDVVTTGGSIGELVSLVQRARAELVGVGFIVDRSGGKAHFDVEKFSILEMEIITHKPDECPLCRQGVPLVKPGSRSSVERKV